MSRRSFSNTAATVGEVLGAPPGRSVSVLPILLIAAVAVVLGLLSLTYLRRGKARDEVQRFHHARTLTTTWSEGSRAASPLAPGPASPRPR